MNIAFLMVVVFLLLSLTIGLYFSKKTTSLREYAIGNKTFTTATLVATTLATTWGGGSLVRDVEQVYNRGLYWIVFSCLGFADVLMIIPLSLRMGPFIQHLSIPESIGSVYGKYPRIIAALAGITSAIAIIASQINVMSLALKNCIDIDNARFIIFITVVATLILIFYSTFGGIRAVTFTDVLQFITFSIIIPLLAWFMFRYTGKSITEIVSILRNQPNFQFGHVFHLDRNLLTMVSMVLGIMASIDPTTMQRVYMASGPLQANRVFLYSGIFSFVIIGCVILIGSFAFVGIPSLPVEEVWSHMMNQLEPVFKGCVCIGLLAMTMSTADSKLNTCAVMVSHDIIESVKKIKPFYTHPIRLARCTSIVVGFFSMMLAFGKKGLLGLLMLALNLYVPIVTAPFILALYGFRSSSRTALIGMGTGCVTILVWNQWIKPRVDIDGAFLCMLANGLAMLVAHYLLPKPK